MADDDCRCDSPLVRIIEAVLVAALTAAATGLIEKWIEKREARAKKKPRGRK